MKTIKVRNAAGDEFTINEVDEAVLNGTRQPVSAEEREALEVAKGLLGRGFKAVDPNEKPVKEEAKKPASNKDSK